MGHPSRVCAFTSVCQEDLSWMDQYLQEAERLRMTFAIHFDRCRGGIRKTVSSHPLCVGSTSQDHHGIEFDETHKQAILDVVARYEFDWAMAWDVDETYEGDARRKIAAVVRSQADCVDIRWVNLWGDRRHVRVDGTFGKGHRVKFLNLQDGRRWMFDHPITNGPKLVGRDAVVEEADLTCLHHGMMTRELRLEHKARWDRIYSTALRGDPNPYKFWEYACDEETYPPVIEEYP